MAQFSFPRLCRIRKRREILELQKRGKKAYSKSFVIILAPTQHSCSRLAVTVSKKVHRRAVKRNRVKRRLKELFRLNRHRLRTHFDILIIARKNASELSFQETSRQILGALHHNGYLKHDR